MNHDDPNIDAMLLQAIKRGASMEDIAKLKDPDINTPEEALATLKRGNERFFSGQSKRPEVNAFYRRAQIQSQTPFATILGCSDSRVPVEIVFDQGLGDLFIVRVAGNLATEATLGSVEYAITHLKCHLVIVLGHEGCGAVKAALLSEEVLSKEPESIQHLVRKIQPAVQDIPKLHDHKAFMREAIVRHTQYQVEQVKQSPEVQKAILNRTLKVVGAYYEISSGAVDFFDEP